MSSTVCGSIIFAVLFNGLVTGVTSNCPSGANGWLPLNCSCFIVKHSSKALNWDEAKKRCSSEHSATLASIKSSRENDILGINLNKDSSWIGLQAEANSSFLLPNGDKATFLPEVGKRYGHRTCIAIRPNNIWKARSCDKAYPYICSKKSSGSVCPPGWRFSVNSCYWISKAKLTFKEARRNCAAMQGKLAELSTKREYKFLRKQLPDGTDNIDVWFGLHKVANATNYTYSDGSEPDYTSLGVQFIPIPKSPATFLTEYCVVMLSKIATWEAKECSKQLYSYLCQAEIKRDFNITVTSVNETSARISWSIQPPHCGLPNDTKFTLVIREGSKVKRSKGITSADSLWIVGDLKPKTQHEVVITDNKNMIAMKNFSTAEIGNPLALLTNISSNNIHATHGDTVNLLCAARGEPPITFSWEKDQRKLQSYVETETPHHSSILSVQLINPTSYGKYICHIQDRFGNKTHEIEIVHLPKEDSDDNWFVIVIVILAITVAILLIIIAYFINYLKKLKLKLKETKKADVVTLTNVSNAGELYEKPLDSPNKTSIDGRYVSPEDENAQYTALNRNGQEEEDNFYAPLKEAPLYVNATEFNNTH